MHASLKFCIGLGLAAAASLPLSAEPLTPQTLLYTEGSAALQTVPVAQGCGPGSWRGPWGHCRDTPYSGPVPGGGWVSRAPPAYGYFGNGCPAGWWRGPWGHCRDTPYQGRLPNGGWR